MKILPVSLMPILRSQTQGRILSILFLNPMTEYSITELASRVSTSIPTALREIQRLQAVGFVNARKLGNTQLVKINSQHKLHKALSEIVLYSFGPIELLSEELRSLKGLEGAFIYGSWAERYYGIEGEDPGDIDLLLIGDVDRPKAFEIGLAASQVIGKEVSVHNLSSAEWKMGQSGFVKTVKSKPMVNLALKPHDSR